MNIQFYWIYIREYREYGLKDIRIIINNNTWHLIVRITLVVGRLVLTLVNNTINSYRASVT